MNSSIRLPTAGLSEATTSWLDHASVGEISLALETGSRMISAGRNYLNMAPVVNNAAATLDLINKSASSDSITTTSYGIGKIGEEYVYEALRSAFDDVINVSSSAASGDLMLYIKHRKITIEIKNYTREVPSAQIDKFKRDLLVTNSAGGVFISLHTPITGLSDPFIIKYEAIADIIPVVYVVTSDINLIISSVHVVNNLIEASNYIINEIYSKDIILESTYVASSAIDNLSRARVDFASNISMIANALNKSRDSIVKSEIDLRGAVTKIKGELFHTDYTGAKADPIIDKIKSDHDIESEYILLVTRVVEKIIEILGRRRIISPNWKCSQRKYINTNTNIGISVYATKIEVVMPRVILTAEWIIKLLDTHAKKCSISDTAAIEIDHSTVNMICDILALV